MTVLKELWTKEIHPEVKSNNQYVLDLKERFSSTCELARKELRKSSERNKRNYDRKTQTRTFKVRIAGDQVHL
ncbi:uncharacterized protein LOC111111486 isoform X4 [Crassostrea virginica]